MCIEDDCLRFVLLVGWFVVFGVFFLVVVYLWCLGDWLSIGCCWFEVGWLPCLGVAYCGVIVVILVLVLIWWCFWL